VSLVTGRACQASGPGCCRTSLLSLESEPGQDLELGPVVTVTFTLVASCVPSVTVSTFELPLLSVQEISTPAGTAPNPCAMFCDAPVPVWTAERNCFCFDG